MEGVELRSTPQLTKGQEFNSLMPRQDVQLFSDDVFKCIFFNENVCISIKISLKFVLKGPIYKSALVQLMAWGRTGDKPLPGPMIGQFSDAYMCLLASMT